MLAFVRNRRAWALVASHRLSLSINWLDAEFLLRHLHLLWPQIICLYSGCYVCCWIGGQCYPIASFEWLFKRRPSPPTTPSNAALTTVVSHRPSVPSSTHLFPHLPKLWRITARRKRRAAESRFLFPFTTPLGCLGKWPTRLKQAPQVSPGIHTPQYRNTPTPLHRYFMTMYSLSDNQYIWNVQRRRLKIKHESVNIKFMCECIYL